MALPDSLRTPINPADHVIGDAAAPCLVVEYGDFECPICAQAYPAVKIMLKHFEGKVRFAFRHFPAAVCTPAR
jgi:protein-disulfide isomerase